MSRKEVGKMEKERIVNKVGVTIRLPKELKESIQKEADKRGISFNEMVMLLINKGMEFIHQKLL